MWQVEFAAADNAALTNLLEKGWEPFAVTTLEGKAIVWLRRRSA